MLASRLTSNIQVFAIISLAVELFALFPFLYNATKVRRNFAFTLLG
jgi:hypothetical protein